MNNPGYCGYGRGATSRDDEGVDGFTLMEALVALTIVAMVLAAIANLANVTLRSAVHVERGLAEIEVARQLVATRTVGGDIASLSSNGALSGHVWRVSAEPFRAPFSMAGATPRWVPAKLKLNVQGPSGASLNLEVVRLVRPRAP